MIVFACGGCGRPFRADGEHAGRRSRCRHCGAVTVVPTAGDLGAALPPRAPAPAVPDREARASKPEKARRREPRAIGRDAWTSLAIGAGLAAAAMAIPPAGFVLGVLVTIIHELGHVATAWFLGSPALPSFDLAHGGGVSHVLGRQPLLILLVYAAAAVFLLRVRDDRPMLAASLLVLASYSIAAFTPIRDLLILAMGHGAELIFAGIFLYRSLSGSQILRGAERPLYAALGLYLTLTNARFACGLIASRENREAYGEAKGGGDWMDFSRIADEHLHVRLEVVAMLFLAACLLPPVAAFLAHRYGRRPA